MQNVESWSLAKSSSPLFLAAKQQKPKDETKADKSRKMMVSRKMKQKPTKAERWWWVMSLNFVVADVAAERSSQFGADNLVLQQSWVLEKNNSTYSQFKGYDITLSQSFLIFTCSGHEIKLTSLYQKILTKTSNEQWESIAFSWTSD
jgi:hypothetical protein